MQRVVHVTHTCGHRIRWVFVDTEELSEIDIEIIIANLASRPCPEDDPEALQEAELPCQREGDHR